MQCHVRMTEDLVKKWYRCWESDIEASIASPAVQSKQEVLESLSGRVKMLNRQANFLYEQRVKGLST